MQKRRPETRTALVSGIVARTMPERLVREV